MAVRHAVQLWSLVLPAWGWTWLFVWLAIAVLIGTYTGMLDMLDLSPVTTVERVVQASFWCVMLSIGTQLRGMWQVGPATLPIGDRERRWGTLLSLIVAAWFGGVPFVVQTWLGDGPTGRAVALALLFPLAVLAPLASVADRPVVSDVARHPVQRWHFAFVLLAPIGAWWIRDSVMLLPVLIAGGLAISPWVARQHALVPQQRPSDEFATGPEDAWLPPSTVSEVAVVLARRAVPFIGGSVVVMLVFEGLWRVAYWWFEAGPVSGALVGLHYWGFALIYAPSGMTQSALGANQLEMTRHLPVSHRLWLVDAWLSGLLVSGAIAACAAVLWALGIGKEWWWVASTLVLAWQVRTMMGVMPVLWVASPAFMRTADWWLLGAVVMLVAETGAKFHWLGMPIRFTSAPTSLAVMAATAVVNTAFVAVLTRYMWVGTGGGRVPLARPPWTGPVAQQP